MSEPEHEQDLPLEEPAPELAPDEAEQEEAAEEEEAQPEPEPELEPDQPQGLNDLDIEKRQKAMVRASDAYVKKIVDALGPDLDGAKPCPLCADFFPGFRFPIMPPAENLPAIRVAIGLEPGDNLPADGYSRSCSSCDGWGFVASGSKVAGQEKLTCYECKGKGWTAVGTERESGSITGANGAAVPVPSGPPAISSNDPPEVEMLKQLGYVVVSPIQPLETPQV